MSPGTLYLVKQVESAIRAHLDEVVGVEGVTAGQYTALTAIQRHPGITVAELSRVSFVRPQTMTQMIATLEEAGLVARGEPRGRRSRTVTLTEVGDAKLERLRGPVRNLEERMLAPLSTAARSEIGETLATMRRALETDRGAP